MTYAHEIAMNALKRAQSRQRQSEPLTKATFALVLASCPEIETQVCEPQQAPKRKRQRPKENLRALAFAKVLADGAALLAAKACR